MNNVNLTGRIGQEPTVHTFEGGEKQTSFSIAVNNGYFNKEKEWVDRTVWVNIVKRGETKLQKGDLIEVSGKLNVRDYENKDGHKVYITEVVAFNTGLLNRRVVDTTNTASAPAPSEPPADLCLPEDDQLPF